MKNLAPRSEECPFCHKPISVININRHKSKKCPSRPPSRKGWPANLIARTEPPVASHDEILEIVAKLLKNVCPILKMEVVGGSCQLTVPNGKLEAAAQALTGTFQNKENQRYELRSGTIAPTKDCLKQNPVWDEVQTYGEQYIRLT